MNLKDSKLKEKPHVVWPYLNKMCTLGKTKQMYRDGSRLMDVLSVGVQWVVTSIKYGIFLQRT